VSSLHFTLHAREIGVDHHLDQALEGHGRRPAEL
jgi:hypothetical protein